MHSDIFTNKESAYDLALETIKEHGSVLIDYDFDSATILHKPNKDEFVVHTLIDNDGAGLALIDGQYFVSLNDAVLIYNECCRKNTLKPEINSLADVFALQKQISNEMKSIEKNITTLNDRLIGLSNLIKNIEPNIWGENGILDDLNYLETQMQKAAQAGDIQQQNHFMSEISNYKNSFKNTLGVEFENFNSDEIKKTASEFMEKTTLQIEKLKEKMSDCSQELNKILNITCPSLFEEEEKQDDLSNELLREAEDYQNKEQTQRS